MPRYQVTGNIICGAFVAHVEAGSEMDAFDKIHGKTEHELADDVDMSTSSERRFYDVEVTEREEK